MLNNIRLKGFKSFVNEDIELKPLTLLTGLNSSGKSSVIQAIRMMNNVQHSKIPLLEGYGGFEELHSSFSREDMIIELRSDIYSSLLIHAKDATAYEVEKKIPDSLFKDVTYVGADRFGSQPSMPLSLDRVFIGPKGENILSVLDYYSTQGISLDERLKPENAEGLTFDYVVNGWLQYISPKVKFDYKVNRKTDNSYSLFNDYRATNVGFGLSYTLPIIVALLASTIKKGSVILIENPEAHLHPKGQTEMAKLIAKCVECGSQVIVETHSDHLFDGIRIFTKNNPGFNNNVITHWFELDDFNQTNVKSIIFDENGNYTEFCPQGFFDQFEINAEQLLF